LSAVTVRLGLPSALLTTVILPPSPPCTPGTAAAAWHWSRP
jgi:hypothetical protein